MQVNAAAVNGNRPTMSQEPDPQVVPKAERRRFSTEYKLRILAEADRCIAPDDVAPATGSRHPGPEAGPQA
jgi:hypothetical protein